MSSLLAGAGQLLPAAVALALATVAWPRLFVSLRPRQRLAYLTPIVTALALWVAVDILLSAVRAAELATLLAVAIAIPLGVRTLSRRRAPRPAGGGARPGAFAVGLDLFEAPPREAAVRIVAGLWRRLGAWCRARLAVVTHPADALLAATLAAVFLWHLLPYLEQAAPATSLTYQWLLAAKMVALDQGLFSGGVVAPGLPAWLSAMSSLFAIDMLNWLRLAPPFAALFLAAGSASLADSLTGSRWLAVTAAVAAGLTHVPAVGNLAWSATEPVVPQLAAAWVVLWLAAGVHAMRSRAHANRAALWSAAFLAGAFDPTLAAFGIVVTILLAAFARADRRGWHLLLAGAGASVLPMLVPALGLVIGRHAVANLWQESGGAGLLGARLGMLAPALGVGAIVATHRLIRPGAYAGRRERAVFAMAAALTGGALFLLFAPSAIASDPLHSGLVTVAAVPVACAWLVSRGLRRRPRAVAGSAILSGFILVMAAGAAPRPLNRLEPPGSALAYLRIAAAYPKYTWTIVSPTTAYPEVLGAGWHTELSQFVRASSLAQAHQRRFLPKDNRRLAITTPTIFLFVNLRPVDLGRQVTAADARLPLPPASDPTPYQGQYGATIEARALLWARAYLASHPGSASIYASNPSLLVVRIRQP